MASNGTFRIAIIGSGGISGAHSGAIKASGGKLALAAAVDTNLAAAEKLAGEHGAKAFGSVNALLKAIKDGDVAVDGVVVATPPSVRIAIVEACLKAGLPLLSEKPLAHTLADAKKLASLSKKYKKTPSYVAYCHRFTPAVLAMKEMINSGKLGTLVRFENAFACDLPGHKDKWFSDPKKAGGGAYLDMGSHSVDLFHAVVGSGVTVGAVFGRKWKGRTETSATVLLSGVKPVKGSKNIGKGVAGVILSGWGETSRFTVAVVGDQGMLSYDYEQPDHMVFKDLVGKAEKLPVEGHGVRFQRQLEAFAAAVQKKAKTGLATFEDGLLAAQAFDKALKLAK
ncbi:MAG: Gfo/Idh/MocA family oxidoreductase [Phycisphaerales bacterium]|nr:Gfo/Idh/MocA family oxidoreductase [Phycisphaerales bacterium]